MVGHIAFGNEKQIPTELNNHIKQGSQTQIHREATFGWKISPQAKVLNKKGSAGHNMEKTQYLVQNLAILDLFCLSIIKLSNFVCLKESREPHKHIWRAACLRPLIYFFNSIKIYFQLSCNIRLVKCYRTSYFIFIEC
jgi:hypothetical protein